MRGPHVRKSRMGPPRGTPLPESDKRLLRARADHNILWKLSSRMNGGQGVYPCRFSTFKNEQIEVLALRANACVVFGSYHIATIDKKRAKTHNILYSVEPE